MIGKYVNNYNVNIIFLIDDNICYEDYPTSITVSSTGPAAEKQSNRMGLYNKDDEVAFLRPVYKKIDRDDYIFYDSKLYFINSDHRVCCIHHCRNGNLVDWSEYNGFPWGDQE